MVGIKEINGAQGAKRTIGIVGTIRAIGIVGTTTTVGTIETMQTTGLGIIGAPDGALMEEIIITNPRTEVL
ncbi:hypothetical protein [Desulfosporosinus sp. OT]|uniref:hypothetical protein n=1 Tax=Desulfosporosinus sp. OT TaxID=913865 RepID=UPI000223A485|nr:hypothetical protein [Desulfosporosinus sp. OT]EGW38591.1 hypothetical protein DOT_3654 [Desulfosporosinus sp. OT]